jgi:hypothetical protein
MAINSTLVFLLIEAPQIHIWAIEDKVEKVADVCNFAFMYVSREISQHLEEPSSNVYNTCAYNRLVT